MELLQEYGKEIAQMAAVGIAIASVALFGLGKLVDSGKLDSKETRIFIKEKEFENKRNK